MRRASNNLKSFGKGGSAFPAFPIILGLIIILCFLPIRLLMAHDLHDHHYLAAWPMVRSDAFTVSYTHSVELTEVKELYRLSNRQIVLTETIFSSYGAGLPATTEYPFEITDDGFRIYQINQVIDPLVYRTGAERADHRLLIGKKAIPFLEFSQAREGVVFTVRYQPLFYYLFKEVLP